MGIFTSKKIKEEQKKVIDIILKLISTEDASLDARYKHTHGKVAINYKEHVIELIEDDGHGNEFTVKFYKSKVSLTKKQFSKVISAFDSAKKLRNGHEKDFDYLQSILQN